jgi:predicted nicotinamide N-methyase
MGEHSTTTAGAPDRAAFVDSFAPLAPVAFVPELVLHQAPARTGLWDSSGGSFHSDAPPPFWAFAWPGGTALARYVLDEPATVRGQRVLDLAAGSGIAAIAAARAGARAVLATEIDPDAVTAIGRNAAANGVTVVAELADVLDGPGSGHEVVLVGDGFYQEAMARRMLAFLRRAAAAGARVLVGDPDRAFLPQRLFERRAGYAVPVRRALEDTDVQQTTVWELR